MAKVRFYAAKLPFSVVKNLYNNYPADQFAALIFQQEIKDAASKNDEYVLVAYPVDNKGKITTGQQKIDLTTDTGKYIDKKKKVNLANLPLSRAQIKYYIDRDPSGTLIDHLYFTPKSYPDASKPDDPYVAYSVEARDDKSIAIVGLTGDDLNPSPPATPSA